MTPVTRVLNPQFHGRNLVAYNFAAFACISFVVFLLASQPFYLSDVIGISPDKLGQVSGSLGVADELVAMVTAPFVGTLNDRIQGYAWKSKRVPSGPRTLELAGFMFLALALVGYGQISHHAVPDLYIFRSLFAVGVASVMSMAVVMLHEASNSDFTWQKLKFWRRKRLEDERTLENLQQQVLGVENRRRNGEEEEEDTGEIDEDELFMEEGNEFYSQKQRRSHGKLSALLGMCTGLGALLAVAVFLPLPARLAQNHASWSSATCLRAAYTILGLGAIFCGGVVFLFGYDSVKQRRKAHTRIDSETPDATYIELMREAWHVSVHSRKVQLAYIGGLVARSLAVVTSVFTPLVVYKYYQATGACGTPPVELAEAAAAAVDTAAGPDKNACFNAFIFLAILTGVSSTVSLFLTPVWSMIIDSRRLGCRWALLIVAVLCVVGSFGLCIAGNSSEVYDPRNAGCFFLLSVLGVAQMGAIIASMSLLTKAGQLLEDVEHRVIGSITGIYNLCGGVGILLVSMLSGAWSDRWVFGPFFILGLLGGVLCVASGFAWKLV